MLSLAFVAEAFAIPGTFDWGTIITNLGFGGFVMWFAYHTQTKTFPAMQAQHQSERESSRKDFLEALSLSRKDYLAAEADQRQTYNNFRIEDRTDLQSLIQTVNKLAEITSAHIGEARAVWQQRGEQAKLKQ